MARLIAMDLGSHGVKVSTYKVTGRTTELEKRFHRQVPQEGPLPTLEHRLAALDALLDDTPKLKPQSSDVLVLSWPSHEAAFHRVAMPFSDRAQIERTLPFAVENEVPFELDDMVLSWRITELSEQTQVLAVLARRERVQEWLNALSERGLDPASVHVVGDLFGPVGYLPPVLASDEAVPDAPTKRPMVAVIDIGHVHTTVSIVRDQAVQFARSVNVAGHSFTRGIQEALQCTWEEAERLKHGNANRPVTEEEQETDVGNEARSRSSGYASLPAEARAKVDNAIGLLLAEIRSTLIKAEDQLAGEIVEVRLCGGSSAITELVEYIEADLGVPVRLVTDVKGQPLPVLFGVTYGLAQVTSGNGAIDLRVGALAYKGKSDLLRSALGYGIAGAMVFSLALLVLFGVRYRGLVVEQQQTEAAVREIVKASFPEVPDSLLDTMDQAAAVMAQNTQDAMDRAEVLGDGSHNIPPTLDTLHQLTVAFPPHPDVEVELSELTITKQAISFNAEATGGYASSAEVENRLKANPRFKGATKGQETRLASGAVRFPITIPLDGADAAGDEG